MSLLDPTSSGGNALLSRAICLEEVRIVFELLLDLYRVSVIVRLGCIANLPLSKVEKREMLKEKGRATYDIQSTDQLAVHPELRVRRPVRELLEPLPHVVVGQDVEEAVPHAALAQERHELPREPALRRAGRALDEQHDARRLDELAQPLEERLLRLGRVGLRLGLLGRARLFHDRGLRLRCGGRSGSISSSAVGGAVSGGVLRVRLDRRPHLDGAAAAHGLEDLVVALQHQVRHGGDVVRLGDVAQLLGVDGHPARLAVRGILGREELQDGGHLRARCGPRRVEGDYEEGGGGQRRDVRSPVVLARDLFYGRHYGCSCGRGRGRGRGLWIVHS